MSGLRKEVSPNKVSASDVANYFINLSYKDDEEIDENVHEGITNLKLQKLLYFAQAAHLAIHDEELFEDEIEAWKYGPVVPSIYRQYNVYKNQPLLKPESKVKLDGETRNFLDGIWELFDKYSAAELMHITHQHKPWKEAYKEGQNVVISSPSMRDYYKGIFELQETQDEGENS